MLYSPIKCVKNFHILWDVNIWVTTKSRRMKLNSLNVQQNKIYSSKFEWEILCKFQKRFHNFLAIFSEISGRLDPFVLCRRLSSFNFCCVIFKSALRILSQIHASQFDCVQTYSNTRNTFSFPVNGISITEKKKSIKHSI